MSWRSQFRQRQCVYFTLVSKHPISACVFITIKGNHRVHPHFPSPCERMFTLIFPLLVNEFQSRNRFNVWNSTDLTRRCSLALALAVRGQHVVAWGESTLPAVGDRTHTWQPCSVTISEAISTAEYNFDFRYIAPLCWLNGIVNDTNPAPVHSAVKKMSLGIRAPYSYTSRWIIHKVDPSYEAYGRQNRQLNVVFTIDRYAFMK